jgi:hypothetical protein
MAKRNRFYLISALVLAGTTQFCGTDTTQEMMMMPIPPAPPDHPPEIMCATGQTICMTDLGSASLALGQTITLTGELTATSSYTGTVNLTVDRTVLDTSATPTEVITTVAPASVMLMGNTPIAFTVTVKAATNAPPVSAKSFIVKAVDMNMPNIMASSKPVNVDTKGELTVEMFNSGVGAGNAHAWKLDGVALQTGAASPDIKVASAKWVAANGGVQFRFVNKDPVAANQQVIHSAGPIPHGNTGAPLQPDAAYMPAKIGATQAGATSQVYCHTHGPTAAFMRFVFN